MIVIPYARALAPETRALGEQLDAKFIDVSGDEFAYYRLLKRLWAKGESFAIVEQDILPTTAIINEMLACGHRWCSGVYLLHPLATEPTWALGCVKFSSSLMHREADLFTGQHLGVPCHWVTLDNRMLRLTLTERGYRPHLHEPAVRHLRVEPGGHGHFGGWPGA